jgi:hypothetical protein
MGPVRVGGKEHAFVVDTGSSRTVFDVSVLLGKQLGTEIGVTPDLSNRVLNVRHVKA